MLRAGVGDGAGGAGVLARADGERAGRDGADLLQPLGVDAEVDAGVGGAVAQTVGRLMRQLGQDRQVLAVTHLPQVAAFADQHLVVAKRGDTHQPVSTVAPVSGEQRVAEIARMLGGERLSSTTLAHATEMLAQCL